MFRKLTLFFVVKLKSKKEENNIFMKWNEAADEKWNEDCAPNKSMQNAKKRHINSMNPFAIYLCFFFSRNLSNLVK